MKLNTLLNTAFLAASILMASACGSEPGIEKTLLYGRWELKEASRNGSPTESLAGLYFVFREDGSMETNLPVAPGSSSYKLAGNGLTQAGGPGEVKYTIEELDNASLVLTTELRNTNFRFLLQKQASEQE